MTHSIPKNRVRLRRLTADLFNYRCLGLAVCVLILGVTCFPQAPPLCPPIPPANPPESEPIIVPYIIAYGVKATDRTYGNPGGISKQTGTLTFSASVFKEQVDLTITNWNFVVGRDSTGERAVNFGNTATSITVSPNKLKESTLWKSRRFYPSVSFDYTTTFPTGSRSRGLNVGKVDHDLTVAIVKLVGKKIPLKNAAGGLKDNFARRTSIEADFGISFSSNEDRGHSKTGNFVFVLSHTLLDMNKKKYKYAAEFSMANLATGSPALRLLNNSLSIKLDDSGTRLKLGLITGLSKSTPRVGFNASLTFFGEFKRKRS
jgi:hypothetical protein